MRLKDVAFCHHGFSFRKALSARGPPSIYEQVLWKPHLHCQPSTENHSLVECRLLRMSAVALKVKACFKINLDLVVMPKSPPPLEMES